MFRFLTRIFGSSQERKLAKFHGRINEINKRFENFKNLSKEEWESCVVEFRKRNSEIETLLSEDQIIEGAALFKAAGHRILNHPLIMIGHAYKWDMVPFDEQIIAGMAMYEGNVAEMQTGEGKTLAAVLPLFLHSINRKTMSVTVNDYLAQRDCEWMSPLFNQLNTTVGYIKNMQQFDDKKIAYSCNVIYGTASEFGFDYLRDHSRALSKGDIINNEKPGFLLIDEVDHILISEAKTPLIISGNSGESSKWYSSLRDPVESICEKNMTICSGVLEDATAVFDAHGWIGDRRTPIKEINESIDNAAKNLWLVYKSNPYNKELMSLLEYAGIRELIDKWDVYFSYDFNKDEMYDHMQTVLLVADPRARNVELTDYGISAWDEACGSVDQSDFKMIDLGIEIDAVNKQEISKEEKIEKINEIKKQDVERQERAHCMNSLFYAFIVMKKDEDYIVENGEIVILDESTGRLQYGRRFSGGIHQGIESKERIAIKKETVTIASITIQNFVKIFPHVAGMSGTAVTHETEFSEIYGMNVITIPLHKPSRRVDLPDQIYVTKKEKIEAVINEIIRIHAQGRPILVGTYSIEESEAISDLLRNFKVPHNVLSAKNHRLEAEIIAKSGSKGSVTVATNMAGRGTDIKLDTGINTLGGMHVIVSSRGKSRAQDLQFRGRQGRQGDKGSCQFFISFEDEILKTFQSPALVYVLKNYKPKYGESLSSPLLSSSIATAQERLEHSAYQSRKHAFDYDSILNVQRKQIYEFRDNIIKSKNLEQVVEDVIYNGCECIVQEFLESNRKAQWEGKLFRNHITNLIPVTIPEGEFDKHFNSKKLLDNLYSLIIKDLHVLEKDLQAKAKRLLPELKFSVYRMASQIILGILDKEWKMHLESMSEIKDYTQLRAIGQRDPLYEYKKDASSLFNRMRWEFDYTIVPEIFKRVIFEGDNVVSNVQAIKEALENKMKQQQHQKSQQKIQLNVSE